MNRLGGAQPAARVVAGLDAHHPLAVVVHGDRRLGVFGLVALVEGIARDRPAASAPDTTPRRRRRPSPGIRQASRPRWRPRGRWAAPGPGSAPGPRRGCCCRSTPRPRTAPRGGASTAAAACTGRDGSCFHPLWRVVRATRAQESPGGGGAAGAPVARRGGGDGRRCRRGCLIRFCCTRAKAAASLFG